MKKEIIKSFFSSIQRKKNKPRIIYYHSVGEKNPRSMPLNLFRKHLETLKERGIKLTTASDLMFKNKNGTISDYDVALSFDDGYLDNYAYIFPLLQELNIYATFFISTANINKEPSFPNNGSLLYYDLKMMSEEQLIEMAKYGMEIGSHTKNHVHMASICKISSKKALEEATMSKKYLEEITQKEVLSFAYPNGQKGVFNNGTSDLLRMAGYEWGFTTIWGTINQKINCMTIPRCEVKVNDSTDVLINKIEGSYDFLSLYAKLHDRSKEWRKLRHGR